MLIWAHPSPHPKRHLDRFSRFCRAHDRDRQTDRQTDHVTRSVTIGRIYVSSTAMRPNNNVVFCSDITYRNITVACGRVWLNTQVVAAKWIHHTYNTAVRYTVTYKTAVLYYNRCHELYTAVLQQRQSWILSGSKKAKELRLGWKKFLPRTSQFCLV